MPTNTGSSPRRGPSPSSRRPETLAGWGGHPVPGRERVGEDLVALTRDAVLTRGLGRAYGDAALPPAGHAEVAGTRLADRILAFDPASGVLRAEAGLSLRALHALFLPRGWASPVSPGTQEVTLGGMVAADVHGKNHHRAGTIGRHVRELLLRVADGRLVRCSRAEEAQLFRATLGGMGLTGHVLEVELALERIPTPWIASEVQRFAALAPLVDALREASRAWPFTAAWLDLLADGDRFGRGVLHCGRWCRPEEAPAGPPPPPRQLPSPPGAPEWLINPLSGRLFNTAYHAAQRPGRRVVSPTSFFYPLDRVQRWNRLYGRRGMTQHQCVLPDADVATLARFLRVMRAAGGRPYLVVLKDFGAAGEGILSFPRPGLTLTLDFAVDGSTPALVAALDREVIALGGRVYLAKDAFTTREHFAAMEGTRLAEFREVQRRWDPHGRLRSRQAERLGLVDPPAPLDAGSRLAQSMAAAARAVAAGSRA